MRNVSEEAERRHKSYPPGTIALHRPETLIALGARFACHEKAMELFFEGLRREAWDCLVANRAAAWEAAGQSIIGLLASLPLIERAARSTLP